MSAVSQIRVLVADDHQIVREGLVAVINREPDMTVVAQAATGQEAVALYGDHRPDVALVDLRMPGMEGVEVIAEIRERYLTARLIVLTTFNHEEDIYRALRAGARAYLLKDLAADELLDAIRAVHAGQKYIPQVISAKLTDRLGGPELTPRELDVLRLIVAGKTNQEIAAALAIAEGTVKFHINHILAKLGVADRAQAVGAALCRGIVHL